ncbi:glycosyltransferase [Pelagibacteraceae bacterium]|nr:glycosyltransferase [Pelagibacteraceae bacterium]
MKITCFIDDLNPGGAQRQICYLAKILKEQGHDVAILTYNTNNFFIQEIKKHNIKYFSITHKIKIINFYKIIKFIRSYNHDVVIAYLRNPVLLAEIASIRRKNWKLIVSERNAYINNDFFKLFIRRVFHLLADHIVVNSNTNKELLNKNAPWLRDVTTIYNYVDLDFFKPINKNKFLQKIVLLGVGKYSYQKNINNLIEAIKIIKDNNFSIDIKLNWFGDTLVAESKNKLIQELKYKIKRYKLESNINLYPATKDVINQYRVSSALILPSFYEGLPNVACEAMSVGLPLLLSNVCDNKNLVENNKNGFLFNPSEPQDIANKIIDFANLQNAKRIQMGSYSRKKSLTMFNKIKFIDMYSKIINSKNKK